MTKNSELLNSNPSRRKFVKNSAVVVGGILASQLPVGASAYVKGDDTIKVALIGCGGRGTGATGQALTADPSVQLVAMADAFRDRLDDSYDNLIKKFPDGNRIKVSEKTKFTGFDAYKKAIDKADVVILTTPPGFRPIHFEYAVNAGKHVFMEKPVATDAGGVRKVLEMAKVAKQKNLNVVVGLQRRYQNNYLETYKKIQEGAIGDIVSGQVYWNSAGVWVRPREAGQTEMEYQMRNWYYFNWLCGDHILEQHIHNIDVANWFIGSYPVSAQGFGGREVRTGIDHGEIFDHHAIEFTYAGGQVVASQCRHQPGCDSRVREQFQTTTGRIEIQGGGNKAKLTDWDGNTVYNHRGLEDPNPYQVEHDRLFASIKNGDTPINNVEYGAYTTMTAILGRNASYSGQVVNWDEALASTKSIMPERYAWDANPPSMPDADGRYPIPVPGVTKVI
ncbi:Gfo/Idh/MocA family oxidoreductase [Reichenbachiella sp. MALMAid0571]|uniref:Gfo/Idh/MocA family protein n=1 Tax=Reichenbachiella sp. MALMAid0571 TaxID=3143939 RepID=UPI0032DF01A3